MSIHNRQFRDGCQSHGRPIMIICSNTEIPCVDQYRVQAKNRKEKHCSVSSTTLIFGKFVEDNVAILLINHQVCPFNRTCFYSQVLATTQ